MSCANAQVTRFETRLIELCNDALKKVQNALKIQETTREEEIKNSC